MTASLVERRTRHVLYVGALAVSGGGCLVGVGQFLAEGHRGPRLVSLALVGLVFLAMAAGSVRHSPWSAHASGRESTDGASWSVRASPVESVVPAGSFVIAVLLVGPLVSLVVLPPLVGLVWFVATRERGLTLLPDHYVVHTGFRTIRLTYEETRGAVLESDRMGLRLVVLLRPDRTPQQRRQPVRGHELVLGRMALGSPERAGLALNLLVATHPEDRARLLAAPLPIRARRVPERAPRGGPDESPVV